MENVGKVKAFSITAPLRFDTCAGHTDIPPFNRSIGTVITNLGIDAFSDSRYQRRENVSVSFEPDGGQLSIFYNNKFVDLTSGQRDQMSLIRGLVNGFLENKTVPQNWKITIANRLPRGTGLGCSASIATCLVAGLMKVTNSDEERSLDPNSVIKTAHDLEVNKLGIVGGFQDHIASFYGNLSYIDFHCLTDTDLNMPDLRLGIPLDAEIKDYLNRNMAMIVIRDNNRASQDIIAEEIKTFKSKPSLARRSLTTIREDNRKIYPLLVKEGPLKKRLEGVGELMNSSWKALKTLSPKIGGGILEELEESIEPLTYGVGGSGAGSNGLSFVLRPGGKERLPSVVEKIREPIDILYGKINELGLTVKAMSRSPRTISLDNYPASWNLGTDRGQSLER